MPPKIVVVGELLDILPFSKILSWEKFQTFCADLLKLRPDIVDSREYLSQGHAQHGIDVYATKKSNEKRVVAQCKLKKYVGPQAVLDVIEIFLKGKFVSETDEFILCISADLSKQKDEEETIRNARAVLFSHGIKLVVWDEKGLSQEIRTNTRPDLINLVYRYFDEDITHHFFGNIWVDYLKGIRKVTKKKYDPPEDYIERNVRSYLQKLDPQDEILRTLSGQVNIQPLIQQYEPGSENKKRKIILLSVAGFGKTEELKKLAAYFSSDEKILYPIKFILRDYEGQPLESILAAYDPNWRNIGDDNILLVFDGLDEIREHQYDSFINHLNAFIEQHPTIQAIVSSRFNFYDIKQPKLRNFEIFLLDPLNRVALRKYVEQKLKLDAAAFYEIVEARKFNEYLDNPYYLARLVRFFLSEPDNFPKNKTKLFDKILFERLEKDQSVHNVEDLKTRLVPITQRISCCMTIAGKSTLTDDELKILVPENETRKLLNQFGIFNRNVEGIGSWSFEHKNLQEYLCASALASASFIHVHKIVSFDFDRNRLMPRFLNTISFLFELANKKGSSFAELLEWLNLNEPELLIRFEKEQIAKGQRNEIFFHLYNYYKAKGITMRSSPNFYLEDLAAFVGIDATISDFLMKQISPDLPLQLALDTLSLLGFATRPHVVRNKLTTFLFSILATKSYNDSIHAEVVRTLMHLQFLEKYIFERILLSGINFKNLEIRNVCMHFLGFTDYIDLHSEFIVNSIPFLNEARKRTRFIQSDTVIKNLILKFKEANSLKKVFQYCAKDENCMSMHSPHNEFHFELNELRSLLQAAASVSHEDPSLLPVIYKVFCKIKYITLENDWALPFKSYFDHTCDPLTIFSRFYKYNKEERDLVFFARESDCDFLISEYTHGKLDDTKMLRLRNIVHNTRPDLFPSFYEKLVAVSSEKFSIEDVDVNYNERWANQKTKNQQMLLDKKLFFQEAEMIFNAMPKGEIVCKTFWIMENKALNAFQYSIVLFAIREMCHHSKTAIVTIKNFEENYEIDNEWNSFVIETIEKMVRDQQNISVDPRLIGVLTDWCTERIANIDFTKDIIDREKNSFGFNRHIEYVKRVFVLLDLTLDDVLMLKILASDYETFDDWGSSRKPIGQLITEKINDKSLLRTTLLQNIQNAALSIRVQSSQFRICREFKYRECLPYLFETVTTNRILGGHDRSTLTGYYLDLGGEITDFAQFLSSPTEGDDAFFEWHWFLVEKLRFVEEEKVSGILLNIVKESDSEALKIKAAGQLIRMSRIEGLRFWSKYIRENKKSPFGHHWAFSQQYISGMPRLGATEVILDSLTFICDNDLFDPDNWPESVQEQIFSGLTEIAKQDFEIYQRVKKRVSELIVMYPGAIFTDSLKYFSERLTRSYYENQIKEIDIATANILFEQILST